MAGPSRQDCCADVSPPRTAPLLSDSVAPAWNGRHSAASFQIATPDRCRIEHAYTWRRIPYGAAFALICRSSDNGQSRVCAGRRHITRAAAEREVDECEHTGQDPTTVESV
jgi:hypothetical protein